MRCLQSVQATGKAHAACLEYVHARHKVIFEMILRASAEGCFGMGRTVSDSLSLTTHVHGFRYEGDESTSSSCSGHVSQLA